MAAFSEDAAVVQLHALIQRRHKEAGMQARRLLICYESERTNFRQTHMMPLPSTFTSNVLRLWLFALLAKSNNACSCGNNRDAETDKAYSTGSGHGCGLRSIRGRYGCGFRSIRGRYGCGFRSIRGRYGCGFRSVRRRYGCGFRSVRRRYGCGFRSVRRRYRSGFCRLLGIGNFKIVREEHCHIITAVVKPSAKLSFSGMIVENIEAVGQGVAPVNALVVVIEFHCVCEIGRNTGIGECSIIADTGIPTYFANTMEFDHDNQCIYWCNSLSNGLYILDYHTGETEFCGGLYNGGDYMAMFLPNDFEVSDPEQPTEPTPVPPTDTPEPTPVPPTDTPEPTPVPPTDTPEPTPVSPTDAPEPTPVPPTDAPEPTPVPPTDAPEPTPVPGTGAVSLIGLSIAVIAAGAGIITLRKKRE